VVARLARLARALTVQKASLAVAWQAGGHVFTADAGEVLRDDPANPMRTALRQVVGRHPTYPSSPGASLVLVCV
jgi:hypothetical protein